MRYTTRPKVAGRVLRVINRRAYFALPEVLSNELDLKLYQLKDNMDVNDLAIIESHEIKVMFYPQAWVDSENYSLDWEVTDFPPEPRNSIPQSAGVYAFVVEPDLFSLSPANGLFYIGKATNLYQRIGAYISELSKNFERSTRPHIWKMLNRWNGHFKYYYTTTDNVEQAEHFEETMLKALRPPFNKQYDAETSQVMRAFQ